MLGDHAPQPHQAGMPEQVRAVSCQMFIEPDGSPLALPISLASRRLRSISGRSVVSQFEFLGRLLCRKCFTAMKPTGRS